MAYNGSTATSPNPPINLVRGLGQMASTNANMLYSTASTSYSVAALNGGSGLWYYQSSDPSTTIVGTVGYFSDGLNLGMKNGDIIFMLSATSGGSTSSALLGIAALLSTNPSSGFSVCTGTQLLSTQ